MGHFKDQVYLRYYGHNCAGIMDLILPENNFYQIEIIDIWEMSRNITVQSISGKVTVKLPGKEGIAVMAKKIRK